MMARCIDDGEVVLARLELPWGNVDRDPTLTLTLQVVLDHACLNEPLPSCCRLILVLLNGTLVIPAVEDEVSRRRRLARVDVSRLSLKGK